MDNQLSKISLTDKVLEILIKNGYAKREKNTSIFIDKYIEGHGWSHYEVTNDTNNLIFELLFPMKGNPKIKFGKYVQGISVEHMQSIIIEIQNINIVEENENE